MPPRAFLFDHHHHAANSPIVGRTLSVSSSSEERLVSPKRKQKKVKKSVSFSNTVGVICPRHYRNKEACWYNAQDYAAMRQANYDTVVLASQPRSQHMHDCTRGLEKFMHLYNCSDKDMISFRDRRLHAIRSVLKEQDRQWEHYGKVVYPSMLAKVSQRCTASQQSKAIAIAASDALAAVQDDDLRPPRNSNNHSLPPSRRRIFEKSSSTSSRSKPQQPPKRQEPAAIQNKKHGRTTSKRRNSGSKRVLMLGNTVARVFCSASSSSASSNTTKGVC